MWFLRLPPTKRACCCAGIYVRPAWNCCLNNNTKLKVITKSQIEKRQAGTAADSEPKAEVLFHQPA